MCDDADIVLVAPCICTLCCVSSRMHSMGHRASQVAVLSVVVIVGRWLSRLADLNLERVIPSVRRRTGARRMGTHRCLMEMESRGPALESKRMKEEIWCDHVSHMMRHIRNRALALDDCVKTMGRHRSWFGEKHVGPLRIAVATHLWSLCNIERLTTIIE